MSIQVVEVFTDLTFSRVMLNHFGGIHVNAAKRALSASQHATIFGHAQAEVVAPPGPIPIGIQAQNSVAERAEIECAIKLWLHAHAESTKRQDEDSAFKQALISSSPPEALEAITNGTTGTCHLTPAMILELYYATYGTITDADLDEAAEGLPAQLGGATLKDIQQAVNKLRQYFDLKATSGSPLAEADKMNFLSNLLPPAYDLHVALFDKEYHALNTRTFALFSAAMIDATKRLRKPRRSANATTVSGAADANSWDEFMANAAASATAAGFTRPAVTNIPSRRVGKTPKANSPAAQKYCWSHGPNDSHQSSECKGAHPNHVITATFANQQGGKTSKWVRGQVLGP